MIIVRGMAQGALMVTRGIGINIYYKIIEVLSNISRIVEIFSRVD